MERNSRTDDDGDAGSSTPAQAVSGRRRDRGRRIRVKLIGSWCPPEQLCRDWNRMSRGQLRWNDIEVTWEDRDIDYYVIVNRPWPGEAYVPERTLVFQMEPWCGNEYQTWGVKTWGEWAEPDEARFLQVRSHRRYVNNAFWQLAATYPELKTRPIRKTRLLSSICGPKYFDPGHVKRVDFLKFLEAKDDDVVKVDIYAHENPHGFKSYRGPHPPDRKDDTLFPYRYFFAAENNQERNFITEKLWEPLLTETLCFYWGCPNASDYVDPRAFIALDLDDFEGAFQTIRAAILSNEWEKRLDVIRRERQKVLDHYQFFPTLERILLHELRLPDRPSDAELLYHKYFGDALGEEIRTAGFLHSYTHGKDTRILEELLGTIEASGLLDALDRLYIVNVGDEPELLPRFGRSRAKVRLIQYSRNAGRFEAPTLDLLRTFSAFHEGAKILYLHTKGASHDRPSPAVSDWRRLMLHFLVERFSRCLEVLETHDAAGCNLLESPRRHFSGNFWWANAGYLKSLAPVPQGDRHEAEWRILSGEGVSATSLHDSGVDHYRRPYPRGVYMTNPNTPPSSVCLVMIAKNEAHVVEESLASALPYIRDFVVVDTGSTDGTQAKVRSFFASRGINGHVLERPWRDFGSNRSEALQLARELSTSDYLWMLDADDVVSGTLDFTRLTADAYHLRYGPDVEYWRPQVFRRTSPWRYIGVLHEYAASESEAADVGRLEGDYYVQSRRLGSRSRDPKKYEKDAAVLDAALAADPESARNTFYLAQSLFDARNVERALEAYRRRAEMGGFAEEVFYSRYRAARCLEILGRPFEEVQEAYEQCFRRHPHRAEPLVRAAERARNAGRNAEAYDLASRAVDVARPGYEALFVDDADYEYKALDEKAVAAYHTGRHEEAVGACGELLERRPLPDGERARVEKNRDFSVPFVKGTLLRYDAELVRRLARRAPSESPRVTLSITTCKRLGLFVDTVCSFLNSCLDLDLVDRFLCVDDLSSEADREEMRRLFPFFEFVLKGPEDKGHARSLNLIREKVRTPYLVHLEDDWQFFIRRSYIGPAIDILEENPDIGQVLFNRNYAETLEEREIPGGIPMLSLRHGHRYTVHEHYAAGSAQNRSFEELHGKPSAAYWPHFSLRPSVTRTSVFTRVGAFDESAPHFEFEYAARYVRTGLRSAFFDGVHAFHIGRLTSQRGDPERLNAYDLNDEPQFGERSRSPATADAPLRERCLVKLLGDWGSSRELAAALDRQSKGGGRWDEIEVTAGENPDYFVLFNRPGPGTETFVPERTVVFQMEPPHAVATWGEWDSPDPRRFVQVRRHDRFPNCGEWHLARTYEELRREEVPPKTRGLSAIVSAKMLDEGQRLRVGFLKFLEEQGTPVDVYGFDNSRGYRGYRGSLPPRDKREGLLPYRYTLAAENSSHPNYFTEKVLDALLAECLPFYWGCPNLEDHIDPRAFVRLPLEDPAESRRIVEKTIAEEEWSRRIDAIRHEKRRILDELQLFPTLARVVRGHRFASRLGIRVINLDRRPDRLRAFTAHVENVAGLDFASRVTRFNAVDGRDLSLNQEIRDTFRGNDFGFRRGFVGCALSHMALWRELVAGDAPGFLVLEDDVRLCEGFTGQLVELCGQIEEREVFDVLFLGHSAWQARPEDGFEIAGGPSRLDAFDGSRFLGGSFAYVVSRRGAERLLALALRDGVKNGIDRFVHLHSSELDLLVARPHVARALLVPPASGLDSDIQNNFESLVG